MEILIIIALICLNGIFAMSEMSLVSSRRFKLESAKNKGSKAAKVALELSENPTKFLSTVQIGITLIGILLGVYSGENITEDVAAFLSKFNFIRPYAASLSVGIVVFSVTYLSIVLGELLPKRLGMTFPEPIAMLLARPMKILSAITSPFVWLLTTTNDLILNLLGIKKIKDSKVSEEEIKAIIKESALSGEIQDIEQTIVERVFELGDRKVNSLFTHRSDIVFFNMNDSWQTITQKVKEERHSAYPVCENNNLDNIIGMVLLKDLFTFVSESNFNIRDFIKTPLFFNKNAYAYKVLEIFKKEKMHYGIVVDEYGTTLGLITMDDVVEALVGDTMENEENYYQITQRDANSWLVDGQYPIEDFIAYFNINIEFDEKYAAEITTIAGFIIHNNNTLPNVGEKFTFDNYEFEIIDKDGQRIDKILVIKK